METSQLLPNAPSSQELLWCLEQSGANVVGLFRVRFASVCMCYPSPPRLWLHHSLFTVGRCRLPNLRDGGREDRAVEVLAGSATYLPGCGNAKHPHLRLGQCGGNSL